MQLKYPNLFQPLTIRGKTLKCRVVSSPHSGGPNLYQAGEQGYSNLTETAAAYFARIARGGAAIVNTGHLGVDPRYYLGSNRERFNFFTEDSLHVHQLPVMHQMTDLIHSFGSLASIELNHCGQFGASVDGGPLLGPVDKIMPDGTVVKAMDEEEMNRVADYFANAAWIGKRGGFDIVNIHAGHNWLLAEFLSPIENTRTDQYGGNADNRARFPKMVLDRVRARVGEDMIISVRFSITEDAEGGRTEADSLRTIEIFDETADIIHCSVGMIHNHFTEGHTYPMQYMERGCNAVYAREAKKHVKHAKIETIGGINEPEMAEKIIAEGYADLVAMARSVIADPDWARKAKEGRDQDIRPCIRCLRCLNYADKPQTGTSVCTVNPWRILPHPLPPVTTGAVKRVAVIGGGPAGMMAAAEIGKNGHQVTLFEKGSRLGGRLSFADYMEFKVDIKRYRDYLIHQLEKLPNVEVKLNTTATKELLGDGWDAVVVAIGAAPFIPPVPGADGANVLHAAEVFGRESQLGNRVVMVGGGQVGCELSIHLHSMGKQVEVVEMSEELMPEGKETPEERFWTMFFMEHEFDKKRRDLLSVPKNNRVRIHLSSRCVQICRDGVWIENRAGERTFLEADTVILATGFRPDERAKAEFADTALDVIPVGDCLKAGNLRQTSATGLYASFQI